MIKEKDGLVNHMNIPSKYKHLDSTCKEIDQDITMM
jgi:hypothetical protein